MRNLTLTDNVFGDLLRDFNRFSVGFEPTFRLLDTIRTSSASGYPPYDLEQTGDNTYRLSMAVAGFGPDNIEITQHEGVLTVEGKASTDSKNYIYKGIAGRSFKRMFYLNQWVQVTDSSLDNGILTINFVQEIPEAMKPRKIAITSQSPETLSIQ